MRRYQWWKDLPTGSEPSYTMTVQTLTPELFDKHIRERVESPKFQTFDEYIRLFAGQAEIATIDMPDGKDVFYQLHRTPFVPRVDGLLRLIPLDS